MYTLDANVTQALVTLKSRSETSDRPIVPMTLIEEIEEERLALVASANNEKERYTKLAEQLALTERKLSDSERAFKNSIASERQSLADNARLRADCKENAERFAGEVRSLSKMLDIVMNTILPSDRSQGALMLMQGIILELANAIEMNTVPDDYNDIPF